MYIHVPYPASTHHRSSSAFHSHGLIFAMMWLCSTSATGKTNQFASERGHPKMVSSTKCSSVQTRSAREREVLDEITKLGFAGGDRKRHTRA